jgi:hypothetical protein
MDVVFGGEREGVVYDRLYVGDVQAARSHVRRNQQRHLSTLKVLYRLTALPLVYVTMNCAHLCVTHHFPQTSLCITHSKRHP